MIEEVVSDDEVWLAEVEDSDTELLDCVSV